MDEEEAEALRREQEERPWLFKGQGVLEDLTVLFLISPVLGPDKSGVSRVSHHFKPHFPICVCSHAIVCRIVRVVLMTKISGSTILISFKPARI